MDVKALLVVAVPVLLAAWAAIIHGRRREARRAAELMARVRARRRSTPVATANVQGHGAIRNFITFEEMERK